MISPLSLDQLTRDGYRVFKSTAAADAPNQVIQGTTDREGLYVVVQVNSDGSLIQECIK